MSQQPRHREEEGQREESSFPLCVCMCIHVCMCVCVVRGAGGDVCIVSLWETAGCHRVFVGYNYAMQVLCTYSVV